MPMPVLRGFLVVAFFALCAFYLIPVYVPRPAFIPGFAPPPDMWPRTVSLIGILLGLLALILAFRGGASVEEAVETDGSSTKRMALRFAGLVIAFGLFLLALPYVGFLIAIILLTFTIVLMTGERSYRLWIALISVGAPVLLLLFFNAALGTQFPKGALLKTLGF